MFEAHRVCDDYFKTNIKAVTIELNDLIGTRRRRRRDLIVVESALPRCTWIPIDRIPSNDAGADAVMPTGLNRDMLRQLRTHIPVPVIAIAIADEIESVNASADDGVDLWIHYDVCVRAAAKGVDMALGSLARSLHRNTDVTRSEREEDRASPHATFEARRNYYDSFR